MRIKRALAASLCLASLFAVPQAVAEPGGPVTPDAGYLASAIKDLSLEKEFADSVTEVRVNPQTKRVVVFAPDVTLAGEVVEIAKARSGKDVGVDVRNAKYRLSELESARAEVWKNAKSLAANGIQLSGIGIDPEGDGLTVVVADPAKARQAGAALTAGSLSSTDIEFVQGVAPQQTSREFDTPPYAGGISLRYGGNPGHWCTSAFGVRQGASEFLITAQHCFNVGRDIYQGGGVLIGHVISENGLLDAASIRTDTWSGVYTYNDQWKNYRNSEWSFNGMNLCQSGYISNQVCDYTVTNSSYEWTYPEETILRRGVVACRPATNLPGSQHGDSGGPVYSFRADGYLDSRGIVSGRMGHCLLFTETRALLNAWGVDLLTS